MRGSVSVCLYKGQQIEKNVHQFFFEESGLIATLKPQKNENIYTWIYLLLCFVSDFTKQPFGIIPSYS